jgi:chromosome segregation ATPase
MAGQLAVLQARESRAGSPEARAKEAEAKLAEALQRLADTEALALAARGETDALGGELVGRMQRLVQERDALQAQVGERDARIARLQREIVDKTDRLGRLAKEMGELKSKGLGKIFR